MRGSGRDEEDERLFKLHSELYIVVELLAVLLLNSGTIGKKNKLWILSDQLIKAISMYTYSYMYVST